MIPGLFFTNLAEVDSRSYPQDAGGGEVPTPTVTSSAIPCAVQQGSGPERTESGRQVRHGSTASLVVLFASDPGVKANDLLRIFNVLGVYERTVVVDGPAYTPSGQAGGFLGGFTAWQVNGRDVR